ncbi:MAG: hypothetical protein AAF497_14345 [Planctomycetota bacterium]
MSDRVTKAEDPSNVTRNGLVLLTYWGVALLGTAIGGSLFGFIGGPVGMIFGFFIATAVGAPIHVAGFLLTLVGPLVRLRTITTLVCSAATGAASAQAAFGSWQSMGLAATTGALASFLVQRWFLKKTWLRECGEVITPRQNQFSLSDAMIFLTIAAVVLTAGVYGYRALIPVPPQ